ncbi:MAG: potassium channel protein [Chloroflexi bacterium]|nr:MAG: potassium channel protein [Chloroflexota bacterium]
MKIPFPKKSSPKQVQPPPSLFSERQRLAYRVSRRPLLAVVILLVGLVLFGTVGYMFIENWDALDALYMTTITISTIGYGEVRPMSTAGRLFTIVLIITGVVTASYALTVGVELLTSERFLGEIRNRRRSRTLQKIRDHCIICGFGRMGSSLAAEMQARGASVIAVDTDPDVVDYCHMLGVPALQGNASDNRVLQQAGIERATSLVAATRSDAENVFIILTARSINPDPGLQIISRANAENSAEKMKKAGADSVISPYAIAGQRIAHLLIHPGVTSFLDGVLEFGDQQMRLEEFIISPDSPLVGKTLLEARLKAVVLAVNHPGQSGFARPNAGTQLNAGTAIIAMGLDEDLAEVSQLAKGV